MIEFFKIRDDKEFRMVAKRMLQLINAEPGTPEEKELKQLVIMCEKYEAKKV